jgi:hypothetical protein
MMRLAHLILAHDRVSQLGRLIKRLAHPSVDIFLHIDAKANIADFVCLKNLNNVYFIGRRVNVHWGKYSMVKATLCSMEEILANGVKYSHINLLSGQDYLLKSNDQIVDFFLANTGNDFMTSLPLKEAFPAALSRVLKYNFGDYEFKGIYKIQAIVNYLTPQRRVPSGLEMYGLSQWIAITPKSASYVINYLKVNPRKRRFFRMTGGPDEFIFQTILHSSPYKSGIVNDNLRYIKFEGANTHPDTFTLSNSKELISSGKFFARKFDAEVDSDILNYLDNIAGLTPNCDLKISQENDSYRISHLCIRRV